MGWKISKQFKRWTTGSKFGFKKQSFLNPFTYGYWTARKMYRGVSKGTFSRNIAKLLGMSAGPSSAASYSSSIYGPTGSIVGRF